MPRPIVMPKGTAGGGSGGSGGTGGSRAMLKSGESVYDLLGFRGYGSEGKVAAPRSSSSAASSSSSSAASAAAAARTGTSQQRSSSSSSLLRDSMDSNNAAEGEDDLQNESLLVDEEWAATLKDFMGVQDDEMETFMPVVEKTVDREDAKATVAAELEVASSASVVTNQMSFWQQMDQQHKASPAATRLFGVGSESSTQGKPVTSRSPSQEQLIEKKSSEPSHTAHGSVPKVQTTLATPQSAPKSDANREGNEGDDASPSVDSNEPEPSPSTGLSPSGSRDSSADAKREKKSRKDKDGSSSARPRKSKREGELASDSARSSPSRPRKSSSSATSLASPNGTPTSSRKSGNPESPKKRPADRLKEPKRSNSAGQLDVNAASTAEAASSGAGTISAGSSSGNRPRSGTKNQFTRTDVTPKLSTKKKGPQVALYRPSLKRLPWVAVETIVPDDPAIAKKLALSPSDNFSLELGSPGGGAKAELENPRQFTKVYTLLKGSNPRHFIGANSNGNPVIVVVSGKPRSAELDSPSTKRSPGDFVFDVMYETPEGQEILDLIISGIDSVDDKSMKEVNKGLPKVLAPLSQIKLIEVNQADIEGGLLSYEHALVPRGIKLGVLFVKKGQTDENAMFQNSVPSKRLTEFMELMGTRTALNGLEGFSGGLDVKGNSTGTHTYLTEFAGLRVMYHVSTELPNYEADLQRLEKKRHLGNDIVVIVFSEDGSPFNPETVKSEFNHVFCIINPLKAAKDSPSGTRRYRVAFAYKLGCGVPGPVLPQPAVFESGAELKKFLLTKLLNAERAALEAPVFFNKLRTTRAMLMKAMVSEVFQKKR